MRDFQVVAIDPEDVEEGIKDPKLSALRAQGYRTVAVIPVEHKGKPRLAFFMEPPESDPEPPLPVVRFMPSWAVASSILAIVISLASIVAGLLR